MISRHCVKVAAAIGAVVLAGCVSEPKTQPGGAVAPTPAVSWDGTYRGDVQITGIGSGVQRRWCETDPQVVVRVTGNSFTYAMPHPNAPNNPTPVYTATIAPDGFFQSQLQSGVMRGQVVANHMSGTIHGSACDYTFSADRS